MLRLYRRRIFKKSLSPFPSRSQARSQSTGGQRGSFAAVAGLSALTAGALGVAGYYANNEIQQLHTQMAKLEMSQTQRLDRALELQKAERDRALEAKIALELAKRKAELDALSPRTDAGSLPDSRVSMELDKRRKELEFDYQQKMSRVKEESEAELRQQLQRQLAAHHDHLVEQLMVQRAELERAYTMLIEEKILEEKEKHGASLRSSLQRLSEMESILKAREQLDVDERYARELWLICQLLKDALKSKREQSDLERVRFAKEVEAIKNTVKSMQSKNSLAVTALESVPEVALKNGVYTEDDLIERFKKVDKLCKRVALVGDEGGSLLLYMLSYLQSMLLFERKVNITEELSGNEIVDPSKWDTFAILLRVRHCLSERNLEMSLRYANQLRGEARKVAKDWIADLRAHLELRQVADILQAHASSLTVRTLK